MLYMFQMHSSFNYGVLSPLLSQLQSEKEDIDHEEVCSSVGFGK